MSYALLTVVLALGVVDRPPALERAVAMYWDSLAARNRVAAMELVVPEAREAFLQRLNRPFRSWALLDVVPAGPDGFTVIVKAEKVALGNGFHDLTIADKWVLRRDGWKVQPPDFSQARRLWSGAKKVKPGAVRVLPSTAVIHFVGSTRQTLIAVENGLDHAVGVERVEYDSTRFELVDLPPAVAPGARIRFALRYTGRETAKNLASEVTLFIKHGSQTEPFKIPVRYNVISPATRALFGLTPQEAERLENSEGLTPVFQFPDKSRQPAQRPFQVAPGRLPERQDH